LTTTRSIRRAAEHRAKAAKRLATRETRRNAPSVAEAKRIEARIRREEHEAWLETLTPEEREAERQRTIRRYGGMHGIAMAMLAGGLVNVRP
jgi:hypothetical protein